MFEDFRNRKSSLYAIPVFLAARMVVGVCTGMAHLPSKDITNNQCYVLLITFFCLAVWIAYEQPFLIMAANVCECVVIALQGACVFLNFAYTTKDEHTLFIGLTRAEALQHQKALIKAIMLFMGARVVCCMAPVWAKLFGLFHRAHKEVADETAIRGKEGTQTRLAVEVTRDEVALATTDDPVEIADIKQRMSYRKTLAAATESALSAGRATRQNRHQHVIHHQMDTMVKREKKVAHKRRRREVASAKRKAAKAMKKAKGDPEALKRIEAARAKAIKRAHAKEEHHAKTMVARKEEKKAAVHQRIEHVKQKKEDHHDHAVAGAKLDALAKEMDKAKETGDAAVVNLLERHQAKVENEFHEVERRKSAKREVVAKKLEEAHAAAVEAVAAPPAPAEEPPEAPEPPVAPLSPAPAHSELGSRKKTKQNVLHSKKKKTESSRRRLSARKMMARLSKLKREAEAEAKAQAAAAEAEFEAEMAAMAQEAAEAAAAEQAAEAAAAAERAAEEAEAAAVAEAAMEAEMEAAAAAAEAAAAAAAEAEIEEAARCEREEREAAEAAAAEAAAAEAAAAAAAEAEVDAAADAERAREAAAAKAKADKQAAAAAAADAARRAQEEEWERERIEELRRREQEEEEEEEESSSDDEEQEVAGARTTHVSVDSAAMMAMMMGTMGKKE